MPDKQAAVHHVCINAIRLSGALFGYNVVSMIRSHLRAGGLRQLFSLPLPEYPGAKMLAPPVLKS